jgi:hypothetical protein
MVIGGFARRVNERTPNDDPTKNYLRIMLREMAVLEEKVSRIIRLEDDREA